MINVVDTWGSTEITVKLVVATTGPCAWDGLVAIIGTACWACGTTGAAGIAIVELAWMAWCACMRVV